MDKKEPDSSSTRSGNAGNHRSAIRFLSGMAPGIIRTSLYLGIAYLALFTGAQSCQGQGCAYYVYRVCCADHTCENPTSPYSDCHDVSGWVYCGGGPPPGGHGSVTSRSCNCYVPPNPDNLTAGAAVNCPSGGGGWCRGSASLALTATDSQGHAVSFTGTINGGGFSCGAPCTQPLPDTAGGSFSWTALCAGGKTANGSGTYKSDGTPPILVAGLSGGVPGKRGWYRGGPVTLSCSASDALSGLGGLSYGNQNATAQGTSTLSCSASDVAGNTAGASYDVKIDSGAPSASIAYSSSPAASGWFTQPVTVSLQASDSVSGIFSAAVSVNGGGWVVSQTLGDGIYSIDGLAEDNAGNTAGVSGSANVDTLPPVTQWELDSGQWVRGKIQLSGESSDGTSGVASVYLSLDGKSWQRLGSNSQWSYDWDTTKVHNGTYTILARADDRAGNQEHTAKLVINVDNTPPQVTLEPDWQYGKPGAVKGTDIGSWIAHARVTISKPGMASWVHDYDKMPASIDWDQTGVLGGSAGYGDYGVLVEVWDMAGNYDRTRGMMHNPAPTEIPRPTAPVAFTLKPGAPTQITRRGPITSDEAEPGAIILARLIPFWGMVLPLVGMGVWLAASSVALSRDRRWNEFRGIRSAVERYKDQNKINFPEGGGDD